MRRSTTLVAVLLALLAVPRAAVGMGAAALEGQNVVRIEVRSDVQKLSLDRLGSLLVVEVGRPFSRGDLARSLRNLQASGLISEAEGYVDSTPEGIVITLAAWGRVQVEKIRLEGDLEIKEKELRSILVQHENEPLVTSRIIRGVYDLEAYHQRLGYLAASVRSRPQIDLENKTAVVVYEIDPGPLYRVGSISFESPTGPFSPVQLQNKLRLDPGRPFRERAVRADSERMEQWLFSEGYRTANVGQPESLINWDEGTVDLVHRMDVGPLFHVEIHGAEEQKLRKKGLLPVLGNQRYDEAMLLRSVGKIEDYYQQMGHYDVQVGWAETPSDELFHLVITIDPGPKYELSDISFVGNEAVPTQQLMSLISTESKRLFAASSGKLSDTTLEDDIENIVSYYRIHGYWDAEVGPPEVYETEGKLSVTIPVQEGVQRRLVDLHFDGLESVEEAELRSRLPLTPGGSFHPILLEETTSGIQAYFRSQGFESVQLSSTVDWNKEETLADVQFRILEGPRSVVDRIVVRGNRRTQSRVIKNALDLRPGDYFSTGRLLDAQTNLYRLGAFTSVEVKRAPGTPFKGERDILVEVEEGSRHSFTYGFGLDTEDGFTGLFGYTRSNMFGRGVSGRVDLRVGRDVLARALLYQPFLGRRRITSTGSLFYIEETRDSFKSLRRGGQLEAQRIGNSSRTGVLFDYRLVDLIDVVSREKVDRDLEEVEIASLTPNWQLDHRNNPVNPTAGWSSNLQIQYAFPLFQADENFLKSFTQYTHHFSLRWLGTLGGSFRIGAIEPLDKTDEKTDVPLPLSNEDPLSSAYIPISERYFAGGSTTHRAYRRDRLGIPGQTLKPNPDSDGGEDLLVPTGGNGMLLLNLDYRFPIAGPVEGNLFFDTGNVWADWRDMDLAEIKSGLGVGVRYISPVGPIRLEMGWKLDREEFELDGKIFKEDPYVIFFSVGNAY